MNKDGVPSDNDWLVMLSLLGLFGGDENTKDEILKLLENKKYSANWSDFKQTLDLSEEELAQNVAELEKERANASE